MRGYILTFISSAFLMVISCLAVNAQNYAFRVMGTIGQNEIKSGESWARLRAGQSLVSDDQLKVVSKGYVALIHKSGSTMELREPGTYQVEKLEKDIKSKSTSSVLNKYGELIAQKMSEDGKSKTRMEATGAVERTSAMFPINVFLPTSTKVFNPEIIIQWEGSEGNEFKVILMTLGEEEITSTVTSSQRFTLNFENLSTEDGNIVVRVVLSQDPAKGSNKYLLSQTTDEEEKAFMSEWSELNENLDPESGLSHLILAEFYEQQGLFADAASSYIKAIDISPELSFYADAYEEFKIRNGLVIKDE